MIVSGLHQKVTCVKLQVTEQVKYYKSMQLTLLWLHLWVLTAKPFKFTYLRSSTQPSVHQIAQFSKHMKSA